MRSCRTTSCDAGSGRADTRVLTRGSVSLDEKKTPGEPTPRTQESDYGGSIQVVAPFAKGVSRVVNGGHFFPACQMARTGQYRSRRRGRMIFHATTR